MTQFHLLRRKIANLLRYTPFYPFAKTVYRQFFNKAYLRERQELIKFLNPYLIPGSLVFDIGANMGNYIDAFLRMNMQVCAVEPNPFCIEEIKSLYGKNSNVTLVDRALGSVEGQGIMYLGEKGMHNVSTMSVDWKEQAKNRPGLNKAGWNKAIEVEVVTLDHLVTQFGIPQFCKIDVEGYEFEVVKGLSYPLPLLSLEYTPWRMEPTLLSIEHISRLGNYEFNLTLNSSRKEVGQLNFTEWMDKKAMITFLEQEVRDKAFVGDIYIRIKK